MTWIDRLCVALGLEAAPHHHRRHHAPPFNLTEHIMTLSAKAQALADELAGLPALIAADKAAAASAVQSQADEDLDGLKPFVDAVAASVATAVAAEPAPAEAPAA